MNKDQALDKLVSDYVAVKTMNKGFDDDKKSNIKDKIISELSTNKIGIMTYLREDLIMGNDLETSEKKAYIETQMLFARYGQIQEASQESYIPKSAYSYVISDREWDNFESEYGVFLAENASEEAMEDGSPYW